MESGLDGRNNDVVEAIMRGKNVCLNGVRPRWPEQSGCPSTSSGGLGVRVSMESGLDGRNNQ